MASFNSIFKIYLNESRFDSSCTCIKSGAHANSGVGQDGAMSPCLLATFIDDIVTKLKLLELDCNTILKCTSIFLYANNIMLIPTLSACSKLCHTCGDSKLLDLDMSLNKKKSVCMRFGARFNATCANLTTLGGDLLARVGICCYLGVYFSSARALKCCSDNCKASLMSFTVALVVVLLVQ